MIELYSGVIIGTVAEKKAQRASHTPPAPKPEPSILRWFLGHIFSLIRRHGNVIAFWFGIAYIAHQTSLAFISYAGRTSTANLSLAMMANVNFVWTASIAMT